MVRIIIGLFVVLHGLVHLLYLGQSWRRFELRPGMVWPDGSWALAKLLGDEATRRLAGFSCLAAALGFMAGGAGILLMQGWWRPVVAASAAFSALMFLLFWDGKMQNLPDKGGIGILIDLAILVAVLGLGVALLGF